jgi:thiopeptide-type bacteriocin biosynthesis protein
LQKQLNEKYRARQKDIFVHMDKSKDLENEIEEAVEIFEQRSLTIRNLLEEHCSNLQGEDRIVHFDNWLPSYIHMYMNRLFIAQQRKYELVIYHFLEKYYTSKLALEKRIGLWDAIEEKIVKSETELV